MRSARVRAHLLGIAGAIVEAVSLDGCGDGVVRVRLDRRRRHCCGICEERCGLLTHVSADAGSWILGVVDRRCSQAVRCMDPFHVVQWATDALDKVRREVWNAARHSRQTEVARDLKGARWALWKSGDNLTDRQQRKLEWIEKTNRPLYRAYLLKEHLRLIFQLPFEDALDLLERWLEWADASGLEPFVKLVNSIDENLDAILNTLVHGLSNAIVEGLTTRIAHAARLWLPFLQNP